MYSKEVKVGEVTLHYSGSTSSVERINSNKMIKEDIEVLVSPGTTLYTVKYWEILVLLYCSPPVI